MNKLAFVKPKRRQTEARKEEEDEQKSAFQDFISFYRSTKSENFDKFGNIKDDIFSEASNLRDKAAQKLKESPLKGLGGNSEEKTTSGDEGGSSNGILDKAPIRSVSIMAKGALKLFGTASDIYNKSRVKEYADKVKNVVDSSKLQELGSKAMDIISPDSEDEDEDEEETTLPYQPKILPTVRKRSPEQAKRAAQYVSEIIADIMKFRCSSKKLSKTKFYDMVEAGYTPLIRSVFDILRRKRNKGNRDWILGLTSDSSSVAMENLSRSQTSIADTVFMERNDMTRTPTDSHSENHYEEIHIGEARRPENIIQPQKPDIIKKGTREKVLSCIKDSCYDLLKFAVFFLTLLLWIAFIPIFYPLHSFLQSCFGKDTSVKPRKPEHVMTLVVLSNSVEMVQLFKKEGVKIDEVDSENNNVFHHLAYMSKWETQRSVELFELLTEVYPEANISGMLFQENDQGFSPLECAAQYGSFLFVQYLVHQDRCMAKLTEHISTSRFIINGTQLFFTQDIPLNVPEPVSEWATLQYDITRFENGDTLGKQSSFLNILNKRCMSKEDESKVIVLDEFIQRWIALKIRSNRFMSYVVNVCSFLFTFAITLYLVLMVIDDELTPVSVQFGKALSSLLVEANRNISSFDIDNINNIPLMNLSQICLTRVYDFNGVSLNWCIHETLNQIITSCPQSSKEEILKLIGFVDSEALSSKEILGFIVFGIAAINIFVDCVIKTMFLWKNMFGYGECGSFSLSMGWKRSFLRSIPGSYEAKQLTVLSSLMCFAFPYMSVYQRSFERNLKNLNSHHTFGHWNDAISSMDSSSEGFLGLMFFCMLLRLVSFCFALRLITSFTHSVLATHRIAMLVLRYLLLYFGSVTFFSILSFSYLHGGECSIHSIEDACKLFKAVYDTILFSVSLQGERFLTKEYDAVSVIIVIFYAVFTAILLVSLLASVVRSSIEEMSHSTSNRAACVSEKLGDALSAEVFSQLLVAPCAQTYHRYILNRYGIIIENCRRSYCDRFLPPYNAKLEFKKEIDLTNESVV